MYRSNLLLYTAYVILRGAATSVAIVLWVVFLQQGYGFSLTQVVLLDIPFWAGKLLFEIPTGIVADRFGRRTSLLIGALMSSSIWLLFSLTGSFFLLMIAQFIGAIAATFNSGADEALLYETIQNMDREKEYERISGRMRAVETTTAMIVGSGVGLLAEGNIFTPVRMASLLLAFSAVPLLFIKETGRITPVKTRETGSYLSTVRQAWAVLNGTPLLRWAAAYMVVMGSVSFYAAVFFQPYILAVGLSLAVLGPLTVIVQVSGIFGSLSVGRVLARFGSAKLFIAAAVLVVPVLGFIGFVNFLNGVNPASSGNLLTGGASAAAYLFALVQPVLLAVLQRKISNEARATLLSIQSALFTVFLILTEPGLGVIADRLGVHATYLVMAGLTAACLFPLLWWGRRWLFNGANGQGKD